MSPFCFPTVRIKVSSACYYYISFPLSQEISCLTQKHIVAHLLPQFSTATPRQQTGHLGNCNSRQPKLSATVLCHEMSTDVSICCKKWKSSENNGLFGVEWGGVCFPAINCQLDKYWNFYLSFMSLTWQPQDTYIIWYIIIEITQSHNTLHDILLIWRLYIEEDVVTSAWIMTTVCMPVIVMI